MTYIQNYIYQIIATAIALVVFTALRYLVNSIIEKFGKRAGLGVSRTRLVKKYIDYFIYALAILTVWGIKTEQLFLFVTSILTVIGVAFFAQWSILSNITAGIIVFFSSPFRIGDTIKILDKDYPIEAKIIDIKSFYTLLKTEEGEQISLPNNLLLQKGIVIVSEEEYAIKLKP